MNMNSNEVYNEYNEKDYFLNVTRLVYALTSKMKEHNLIDRMMINNSPEMVNPFYGRVEKNSAYVVEYSRGVPSIIYTHLGGVQIPAANFCRGHIEDYKAFLKDIDKMFGFKEIEPTVKNRMDYMGPLCTITHMPWLEKQNLPKEFKPQRIVSTDYLIGSREEEEYIEKLYQEVNQYFQAAGHSEFIYVDPEKQATVETKVQKKHTCLLFEQLKKIIKKPFKDPTEDYML